jgi:hypothetical protein
LECCHWSSPVVDSCDIDVGWALPTFEQMNTAFFGGHSPPYDKEFFATFFFATFY